MIQTIDSSDFCNAFRNSSYDDKFSHAALELIFEYLEDQDSSMELDVVSVSCDYTEDSPEIIAENYSIDISECDDDQEIEDAVIEYLESNTIYIGKANGTLVYANF